MLYKNSRLGQLNSAQIVFFILLALTFFIPRSGTGEAASTTLSYTIDRSAVPPLNYQELTLIIHVSDASSIIILDSQKNLIPYTVGPEPDEITITTASDEVTLYLDSISNMENVGNFRKASLKNNYAWAYSHGFDDNFALDAARQVFLDRNIPATYNTVSGWVSKNDGWDGDFNPAELEEIIAAGWDINNHTVDHEAVDTPGANGCTDSPTRAERKSDVLAAQIQLKALLANTSRPNYKIIGFAIPCGGSAQWADYPGIVHDIRDDKEADLLYYEGGGSSTNYMDVTPPFDFDQDVIRDGRIDGSGSNTADITNQFDLVSQQSKQNNRPIWYTTMSHGDILFGSNVSTLEATLDYLIATYGSNGTDEVWIAPTATVYSYLLVRDKSVVTQTVQPTTTPPPPPELDNFIYLPTILLDVFSKR